MVDLTQNEKSGAVYVLPEGYSEAEFELSEEEIAFNAFKEEAQDNEQYSKLIVSRVPMNRRGQRASQKLAFLFEAAIDEYSYSQLVSKLRDEYGSGFYKIQARNDKGQLKLNKTVSVEAPRGDTDTATADTGAGAIIDRVSIAMQEQSERVENILDKVAPQNQTTSMKETIEMMTMLLGAMNQNNAPVKTMLEQLTEFKLLKELMSDGGDGMGGEANLYTLLGETVKAFGGPIAAALAAGAESGELTNAGVVAQPALPAPKTTETEAVNNSQTDASVEMRKNIHVLIQNAKAGIDPAQFALILVNNTPAEKEDALWEFISAEDCIDQIIFIEPVAAQYKEWFVELRKEVIDLMSEPVLPEDLDIPEHPDDAEPVGGTDLLTGELLTSEDLQRDANATTLDSDTDSGASVAGAELDDTPDESSESSDDSNAASDTDRGSGDQSDA